MRTKRIRARHCVVCHPRLTLDEKGGCAAGWSVKEGINRGELLLSPDDSISPATRPKILHPPAAN